MLYLSNEVLKIDFDLGAEKISKVKDGKKYANSSRPQLSPDIFDPRKVDPKFLEANFEYFILSTARDDENK